MKYKYKKIQRPAKKKFKKKKNGTLKLSLWHVIEAIQIVIKKETDKHI